MATRALLAIMAVVLSAGAASAHHSFAAFFDPAKVVTIKGTVTEFAFTNPHGIIALDVRGAGGAVQQWRVETNAPVVLQRRGWSRTSVKPGDVITVEGWGSRDGKSYMRMRRALRADGTAIGIPFGQNDG